MYAVENKFEIGEECYTVYRRPIHYDCPICKGEGKFMYNGYEIRCNNCCGTGKLHNSKQFIMDVCKVVIRTIKASIVSNGEKECITVRYKLNALSPLCNVNGRSENTLFKTKEEAEKYCVNVNTKQITPPF